VAACRLVVAVIEASRSRGATSRPVAAVVIALAVLATGSISAGSEHERGVFAREREAVAQPLRRERLLALRGRAPGAIAATARYLAWADEPSRAHPVPALLERDERTGRVRRLAVGVLPQFGLASTRTYVLYVSRHASRQELWAVRHDGRARLLLSTSLAAPLGSRGNLVAWAEQAGRYERVLVRNMATGRVWLAARPPRCRRGLCYRIDAVTLADYGVVFDRAAVGTQPSLIVRRRFRGRRADAVRVANDPQPEVAPSSAGAFYFWLGRGWMRWDFGRRRPRWTGVDGLRSWVVAYEHGRTLLRTGSQCMPRLVVRLPNGSTRAVPVPAAAPGSPKDFGPLCHLMTGFDWRGRRLVVAWAVIPRVSLAAHTDVGLAGVVDETTIP
jgi:hypothetical protein